MDWEALTEGVANAARKAFEDLKSSKSDEDIYAVALYTDEGAMTVCFAANSVQKLEHILAKQEDKSRALQAYFKWTTSEWAYEAWNSADFKMLCNDIRNSSDRSNMAKVKTVLLETMT